MEGYSKASFTLTVEKGKSKGKVFRFDRDQVTIGRSDSCDMVVDDDSISRQHATIVFGGEECIIKDSSTNGTFINGVRVVNSQRLIDGDIMGIGPYNSFRYERRVPVTESVSVEGLAGSGNLGAGLSKLKSLLRQKPLLAGALAVYLVFLLFLFVYFAFSGGDSGRVDQWAADELLKETELFLRTSSPAANAAPKTDAAVAAQVLAKAKPVEVSEDPDPAAAFLVFKQYSGALRLCGFSSFSEYQHMRKEKAANLDSCDQIAQALEGAIGRITARIHELLFLAWIAEGQGQRSQAIWIYERVLAVVPDDGAPSYRFALGRIRALKS